jgi:hypothetical protein
LNKRQISVIRHFLIVIVVTLLFVFGLINLRDGLNRSEMQREMEVLGASIKDYRQKNGSLPSESWIRGQVQNFARLGSLEYRAKSILYDSPPESIVASCLQNSYSMLVKKAYIVLRLDGSIEWLAPDIYSRMVKEQETATQDELFRLYGQPSTK